MMFYIDITAHERSRTNHPRYRWWFFIGGG